MENETTHITIQDTTYHISREFLNKYELEHAIAPLIHPNTSKIPDVVPIQYIHPGFAFLFGEIANGACVTFQPSDR